MLRRHWLAGQRGKWWGGSGAQRRSLNVFFIVQVSLHIENHCFDGKGQRCANMSRLVSQNQERKRRRLMKCWMIWLTASRVSLLQIQRPRPSSPRQRWPAVPRRRRGARSGLQSGCPFARSLACYRTQPVLIRLAPRSSKFNPDQFKVQFNSTQLKVQFKPTLV